MNPLLTEDYKDFREKFFKLVDEGLLVYNLNDTLPRSECESFDCSDCCFDSEDGCLEGNKYPSIYIKDILLKMREELAI